MYNVLFVCACSGELKVVRNLFVNNSQPHLEADFLLTGMGNIQTTLKLTERLSQKKYDIAINIGVCGYKDNKTNCIQIVRSVYAPTGKEILVPQFFSIAPISNILCSEIALLKSHELGEYDYVDMESYGIEIVCEHFRIPRLILKVPVDRVGEETKNFRITEAQDLLKEHIDMSKILEKTKEYLLKLPQNSDIYPYLSYYRWTESETHILRYEIHKYETLTKKDFKIFFDSHKSLEKKSFLTSLKDFNHSLTL